MKQTAFFWLQTKRTLTNIFLSIVTLVLMHRNEIQYNFHRSLLLKWLWSYAQLQVFSLQTNCNSWFAKEIWTGSFITVCQQCGSILCPWWFYDFAVWFYCLIQKQDLLFSLVLNCRWTEERQERDSPIHRPQHRALMLYVHYASWPHLV